MEEKLKKIYIVKEEYNFEVLVCELLEEDIHRKRCFYRFNGYSEEAENYDITKKEYFHELKDALKFSKIKKEGKIKKLQLQIARLEENTKEIETFKKLKVTLEEGNISFEIFENEFYLKPEKYRITIREAWTELQKINETSKRRNEVLSISGIFNGENVKIEYIK